MADKAVSELNRATEVYDEDLLVLEQQGVAKSLAGRDLKEYIGSLEVEATPITGGNRITIQTPLDVAEFDILDGLPGQPGPAGADGTVEFEELTNEQRESLRGPQGEQGPAGNDGVSVTHSWSGTTLEITSASGTSSANLKGEQGETGPAGANATINGVNMLTIEGGNYISATQSGSTLTLDVNNLVKTVTVTLNASSWDATALTQAVTVSGVLASETAQLITPVPKLSNQAEYYEAGVRATAQAANSLTFTCDTVPAVNLTVYVTITEVTA